MFFPPFKASSFRLKSDRDTKQNQINMLWENYFDDLKTKGKKKNLLGFGSRSPVSTAIQIHACEIWCTTVVLISRKSQQLTIFICPPTPPPPHHFVHAQIPQPFYQNPLVPILLLPFIANPPSKKHRRENESQKWRREKSLRGEGPIKREPFPSKECAQRWRKMKEGKKKEKKKKKLHSILSKDRFFSYSERKANREAGQGLDWRRERIEGGGQVVSNTKADERSLWQNR